MLPWRKLQAGLKEDPKALVQQLQTGGDTPSGGSVVNTITIKNYVRIPCGTDKYPNAP